MRAIRRTAAATLMATTCLVAPYAAWGQDDTDTNSDADVDRIVVTGEIPYRDRTASISPELVYDIEFFQQFEPTSVGDQLKRVPGVAFTSDIGEYDSPQLRGLGEGFTQVLINGRPIPGAGNDRTVFVDRIPAEIVDRIEIIRSPSADIDSQGVGGTINIILKDGASLPPGVIGRIGGLYNLDEEHWSRSAAVSVSGRTDDEQFSWSVTVDAQERFNVKQTIEEVFTEDSAGFGASTNGLDLFSPFDLANSVGVERTTETDMRNNEDLSFNGDLTWQLSPDHSLRFDAFYIRTRREEAEDTLAFERDSSADPYELDAHEFQTQPFEQDNFGISVLYEGQLSENVSFESQLRFSNFKDDNVQTDLEDDGGTVIEVERETEATDDTEWSMDGAFTFDLVNFANALGIEGASIKIGAAGKQKDREFSVLLEEDLDDSVPEVSLSQFTYEERRLDGFIVGEWEITPNFTLETGVRLESTDTEQRLPGGASASGDEFQANPSAHVRWAIIPGGEIRASVARTVRRPSIDQLIPFSDSDEPEDDDITSGNPNLEFETSIGFDLGYEQRIGRAGIIGINVFRRDVSNLMTLIRDVDAGPTPGGGSFYTYANTGDGEVSGVELDVSTPLSFIGLDETGFFMNYTRLWSSRVDPKTGVEVSFDHQPDYIYNFGLTHNIESLGASMGFSYQKQGTAVSYFFGEIESQEYGANLEAFIEKRIGDHYVLRLTGNNLLDARSLQFEQNFDGDSGEEILANQLAGIVGDYEVEWEESSPTVMLTLRGLF